MNKQHALLIQAMAEYDAGDVMRIQHLLKVHNFAATIGTLEQLDPETLFILESAAIVHDIGIHPSEQKYGCSDGKYQEKEGPAEARKLMTQVGGYTEQQIERVCWLVGHHHTYHDIHEADHQILIEADFLVNIDEDGIPQKNIEKVRQNIFRTATGLHLLECLYKSVYQAPKKNR